MATTPAQGSALLTEELWNAGNPRFLDELFALRDPKALATYAERFVTDLRPFAAEMLEQYVADGCDRPDHRILVKRLFKHAEKHGDDALMARFLVAFDRFPTRELVRPRRHHSGPPLKWRRVPEVDARATSGPARTYKGYLGRGAEYRQNTPSGTFSLVTRRHLQRRVWRYFRVLGFRDPVRYRTALMHALPRYAEEDLCEADLLLCAWGLMHALFGKSGLLRRDPRQLDLRRGALLKDLQPAPVHPRAWKDASTELMRLVTAARSRTVRTWAMQLLRNEHPDSIRGLAATSLEHLLSSEHEEVLHFGVELLEKANGLQTAPVDWWLTLLRVQNLDAVAVIARLVTTHVSALRVTLPQCVELARSQMAPVAELGAAWILEKARPTTQEISVVMPVIDAPVASVRARMAPWLATAIQKDERAPVLYVRDFLDVKHADVRGHGLAMLQNTPRFSSSTELWTAMAETPFDDVRGALLKVLEDHAAAFTPGSLRHLWATVLLDIERGNRRKPVVVRQVADRIASQPGEAPSLFPLLRVALRSLRAPERRHAIAAVGALLFHHPEHRALAATAIPELQLAPGGAA